MVSLPEQLQITSTSLKYSPVYQNRTTRWICSTKAFKLQDTIDELTLARVSKKARIITFVIAIALFIVEDTILHFALHLVPDDNYLISLIVKIGIIFSLKPINGAVEHYLLKKVVRNKKQ